MGTCQARGWFLPLAAVLQLVLLAAPGAAQEAQQEEGAEEQARRADEAQEAEDPAPAARFTDQVVVSASRVEQEIVNAPAAVTVIGS
ncbi:MAG: hypothetical protein OXU35_07660, partial [Acidobacteriota bacterium]|nr:hypothetical protein [Acidobacteriota bacterium]